MILHNNESTKPAPSTVGCRGNLRIGLISHDFGSPNLGVQALTLGHLEILRQALGVNGVDATYLVVGHTRPNDPPLDHRYTAMALSLRSLVRNLCRVSGGMREALADCDLVLDIGEGDSFADIYGQKRFAVQALIKWLVLQTRVPLILSPQTIGPFNHYPSRRSAAYLLKRAQVVYVRDAKSGEIVRRTARGAKVVEVTDVAFALPYHRVTLPWTDKIRVGLNVSGLLFESNKASEQSFGMKADYRAVTIGLLKTLSADSRFEVHLIPHVVAPPGTVDDDDVVCRQLADEFSLQAAPRFSSPIDAKSYIAAMDFFIGARMHACIAAFSAGVPSVPIAYSRKATGLFESLGYSRVADATAQSTEDVRRMVMDGLAQREALTEETQSGVAVARQRLAAYSAHLAEVVQQCLATKDST